MGKGGGSTKVKIKIPKELKPLIEGSVRHALGIQNSLPLEGFAAANPRYIPDLTQQELALINQMVGFANTPPLQADYTKAMGPPIAPVTAYGPNPTAPVFPPPSTGAPPTGAPPPPGQASGKMKLIADLAKPQLPSSGSSGTVPLAGSPEWWAKRMGGG